jgi:hypothetical protein
MTKLPVLELTLLLMFLVEKHDLLLLVFLKET